MKRLLISPVVNAVCVILFSAFYAVVYLATGRPFYVGGPMLVLTGIIVAMLLANRRKFDEYHAFIMANCLIVALVLMMLGVAIFYLITLFEPTDIEKKLAIFIDLHWVLVVLCDFAYVLLCHRK
jgi:uncharacterized membrane protein